MEGYPRAIGRMTTFLDTRSVGLSLETVGQTNNAIDKFSARWRRRRNFAKEVTQVRRLYAPEEHRQVAELMGHSMRWRQGGSGEARDITDFIINDSRAFCLQDPERSAVLFCSRDERLRDTLEELVIAGAEVFLLGRTGQVPAGLSGLVKQRNIGLF